MSVWSDAAQTASPPNQHFLMPVAAADSGMKINSNAMDDVLLQKLKLLQVGWKLKLKLDLCRWSQSISTNVSA